MTRTDSATTVNLSKRGSLKMGNRVAYFEEGTKQKPPRWWPWISTAKNDLTSQAPSRERLNEEDFEKKIKKT